ncbi:MAG: hypothetical protein GEU71_10065 [Actinobacteria bacterium]|nr:hypothetical protein [Actinomycetota bacterium]
MNDRERIIDPEAPIEPRPLNIDLMKLVFKVGLVVVALVFLLAFLTKGDRVCDQWRAAVDAHLNSTSENLTKGSVEHQRAEERRLYDLGVLWNEGVVVRKPAGCRPTLSG